MSREKAPHIDIVRLEDKEAKLKTFISTFANALPQAGAGDTSQDLLLVVRSLESPAAKAVASLAQDGALNCGVRVIVAFVRKGDLDGAEGAPAFFRGQSIRQARDARLLDAHEQLVLGPSTSWVGDCMRRDPMKRDAYECFAPDCGETTGWARTSFERLWKASIELSASAAPANAMGAIDGAAVTAALAPKRPVAPSIG